MTIELCIPSSYFSLKSFSASLSPFCCVLWNPSSTIVKFSNAVDWAWCSLVTFFSLSRSWVAIQQENLAWVSAVPWESNFLGKRFTHCYCAILEEITTATQHSPIFNEICTADPPKQGKLLRSLFAYQWIHNNKWREGRNLWEEPLTQEIRPSRYFHPHPFTTIKALKIQIIPSKAIYSGPSFQAL